MARIEQRPIIDLEVSVVLSDAEIGALDALAGYGTDAFLKVFYEHMGQSYLKPHEAGLRSLFDTVRGKLSVYHQRMRDARLVFGGTFEAIEKKP